MKLFLIFFKHHQQQTGSFAIIPSLRLSSPDMTRQSHHDMTQLKDEDVHRSMRVFRFQRTAGRPTNIL